MQSNTTEGRFLREGPKRSSKAAIHMKTFNLGIPLLGDVIRLRFILSKYNLVRVFLAGILFLLYCGFDRNSVSRHMCCVGPTRAPIQLLRSLVSSHM